MYWIYIHLINNDDPFSCMLLNRKYVTTNPKNKRRPHKNHVKVPALYDIAVTMFCLQNGQIKQISSSPKSGGDMPPSVTKRITIFLIRTWLTTSMKYAHISHRWYIAKLSWHSSTVLFYWVDSIYRLKYCLYSYKINNKVLSYSYYLWTP